MKSKRERLDRNAIEVERIVLRWTIEFLSRSFVDLASGFARIDQAAARRAVYGINAALAADLTVQRQKLAERGTSDAGLREIAERLHDTLTRANKAIEDSAHPH